MELTLISFNVKNNFFKSEKEKNRIEKIAEYLREADADIIGLQEVSEESKTELEKLLPEYSAIGKPRYTKKYRWNEFTIILVNTERLKILDSSTFWLNSKPELEYSRYFFSIFPRICTYAEVESNGQRIRIFNTHLDHIFPFVRRMQFRVILEYISALNKKEVLPMLGTGDLNTHYNKRNIAYFQKIIKDYQLDLKPIYEIYPLQVATHLQFKRKSGYPIDYIFLTSDFEVLDFSLANQTEQMDLSDHLPLVCRLLLKDSKSG